MENRPPIDTNNAPKIQYGYVHIDEKDLAKMPKPTIEQMYTELEYESLRDEALSMARTLQKIEEEVHECAMCDGREDNGYSAKELLKELSYLLCQSEGYHRLEKYNARKA